MIPQSRAETEQSMRPQQHSPSASRTGRKSPRFLLLTQRSVNPTAEPSSEETKRRTCLFIGSGDRGMHSKRAGYAPDSREGCATRWIRSRSDKGRRRIACGIEQAERRAQQVGGLQTKVALLLSPRPLCESERERERERLSSTPVLNGLSFCKSFSL